MADISDFTDQTPSNTSSAGLGDDDIRDLKSDVLDGLQEEHYWIDGSNASGGEHKVGSARGYVDTLSALSNPRLGAFFVATDDNNALYASLSSTTFTKISSDVQVNSVNTWTAVQQYERSGVSTNNAIVARSDGDGTGRFALGVNGRHEWGPGNSGRDTNLYREQANVLATDDTFHIGSDLTVDSRISSDELHVASTATIDDLVIGPNTGTPINTIFSGSTTISATGVATQDDSQITVAVSNVTRGDVVSCGIAQGSTADLQYSAFVSDAVAGTVDIRIRNHNANSVRTIPAQTINVVAIRPS